MLLILQPLAVFGVALIAIQLIDGTRWLIVFAPLVALLVVWLGQAIHAHRRAVALGARPGGELQVAVFLPLALTVLTAFWLVGGRHGSPAATVEAYMAAWMDARPDVAADLFAASGSEGDMADLWRDHNAAIAGWLELGRETYGPASGLDPDRPFDSLRVRQLDEVGGRAHFVVELVRSERFETSFLGMIPTAAQRTVVVRPVMGLSLSEVLSSSSSAVLPLQTTTWQIDSVGWTD